MISAINLIILLFLNIIISFTSLIYLKKIFLDKKEISNKILNRFGERWGNSKKSHFNDLNNSYRVEIYLP